MRVMILAIAAFGCSPADSDTSGETDTTGETDATETDDTSVERVLVGTAAHDGFSVGMYADEALHVGRNTVAYRVLSEVDAPVDGLTIAHVPMMNMGESSHSTPTVEPVGAGDGWYEGEVVFVMAGTWSNSVTVTDGADAFVYEFAMIDVADTGLAQMVMVGMDKWAVTLTFDGAPVVGDNPFVLTVHERDSEVLFPEVAGLTVDVEPYMVAMGHGSEGNVDPTYTAHGMYEGSANFSMAGSWEARFTLTEGADLNQLVTFQIEL